MSINSITNYICTSVCPLGIRAFFAYFPSTYYNTSCQKRKYRPISPNDISIHTYQTDIIRVCDVFYLLFCIHFKRTHTVQIQYKKKSQLAVKRCKTKLYGDYTTQTLTHSTHHTEQFLSCRILPAHSNFEANCYVHVRVVLLLR